MAGPPLAHEALRLQQTLADQATMRGVALPDEALNAGEFERLMAEGAAWGEEQAVNAALNAVPARAEP